jgi:hypothetical protein
MIGSDTLTVSDRGWSRRLAALSRKTFPRKVRGTADPSASPDFLSMSCGFDRLHVVLFGENHISSGGESGEVGNPASGGMTKERATVLYKVVAEPKAPRVMKTPRSI